MNKNYIIWGISDKGYEDSISSSFPDNIIPSEFKASVSDTHRPIAFTFARENPNDHHFYSIEQVDSNVLYTIYRTNFKGGSVGNRLAYDAATIIISKNYILEKPLNSLKLLIRSYITQKESGFGNFNFENALADINMLANNDKRSISKRYKAGYIKYHSETELSSALVDKKDKLHNFNKVYFFTRLSLLEQGENKIQDLKDYKAIPITIINYDARYYRICVEDKQLDVFGESLNAYKGEEIKVYKAKGNTLLKVDIAKQGLTITLKKHKPRLTNQETQRKRKNKEKITKYIALALCSVVILVTLGFVFFEKKIQKLINPTKVISQTNIETVELEIKENYEFVFDGEYFINSKKGTIKDADTLLTCFKESIFFKNDSVTYTLHFTDDDWKITNGKEDKVVLGDLFYLKEIIKKAPDKDLTREILDHIRNVINYQKLTEGKLEFDKKFWKIDNGILWSKKGNKDFTKYTNKINKKLEEILKESLPENIFDIILENNRKKIKNNKEVNKTNKKIVTRESKSQVKDKCDARVFTNMQLGKTYKRWEKWENKPEDKKLTERFTDEVKELKDLIKKYKKCGCSKCQIALEDGNLKRLIDDGFFQNL